MDITLKNNNKIEIMFMNKSPELQFSLQMTTFPQQTTAFQD